MPELSENYFTVALRLKRLRKIDLEWSRRTLGKHLKEVELVSLYVFSQSGGLGLKIGLFKVRAEQYI